MASNCLRTTSFIPRCRRRRSPSSSSKPTQYVAGQLQSPGYRTSRALDLALLPAGDPALREVTPATVGKITLDDVKQFYAATFRPDLTTIVVIGDVTRGGSQGSHREMVRRLEGRGTQTRHELASRPAQQALRRKCGRSGKPCRIQSLFQSN